MNGPNNLITVKHATAQRLCFSLYRKVARTRTTIKMLPYAKPFFFLASTDQLAATAVVLMRAYLLDPFKLSPELLERNVSTTEKFRLLILGWQNSQCEAEVDGGLPYEGHHNQKWLRQTPNELDRKGVKPRNRFRYSRF